MHLTSTSFAIFTLIIEFTASKSPGAKRSGKKRFANNEIFKTYLLRLCLADIVINLMLHHVLSCHLLDICISRSHPYIFAKVNGLPKGKKHNNYSLLLKPFWLNQLLNRQYTATLLNLFKNTKTIASLYLTGSNLATKWYD